MVGGATPEIYDINGDFCEIRFESDYFGEAYFSNCSGSDEYYDNEKMNFQFDESYNTGFLQWLVTNVTYL